MKRVVQQQKFKKIEEIQPFKRLAGGVSSWVSYIRKTLGMTPPQLARRMGVSTSTLHQLERQETHSKASLKSLKKAAEAMNCDLVYAFIPRQPIKGVIKSQALKRAKKLVRETHLHMEYEEQALSKKSLSQQVKLLADQLENSKKLWDDDE